MSTLVEAFNLSNQDLVLLWTCPLIASISSLIRAWTSELDLTKPPAFEAAPVELPEARTKQTKENSRARGYWVGGMFLAGLGIGFGLAFLFLGSIQPTPGAVGRIWFLSLILGFTTPVVLKKIDGKVSKALDEGIDKT
ncbi:MULTISPECIES: hypothetical protein [unclassified Endozoicomonas]|uniref:hypothetical protein n=1 Tax=unclassified Endozoicomonas TaxID=2644528 RepID=UPI003BB55B41